MNPLRQLLSAESLALREPEAEPRRHGRWSRAAREGWEFGTESDPISEPETSTDHHMNAVILYSTLTPNHAAADYVRIETSLGPVFVRAYVRMQEENLISALDHANPLPNEVVLNSIVAPSLNS